MVTFNYATDTNGKPKYNEPNCHLKKCPYGEWLYDANYIKPGYPILFVYNDDSGQMLKSSSIISVVVTYENDVTNYKIETKNTIYYFTETK